MLESLILSVRIERRWPVQALLGVALLWLALAAFTGVRALPPGPAPEALAALLLTLLPPAALGLVAWALLPGSGEGLSLAATDARLDSARAALGTLSLGLDAAEGQLAAAGERAQQLAVRAAEALPRITAETAALNALAATLLEKAGVLQTATSAAAEQLGDVSRTAGVAEATVRALTADSSTRLAAIEAMMTNLAARSDAAENAGAASLANLSALLAQIDDASSRTTATLAKRAYALDAAVDGVLERVSRTVDVVRAELGVELDRVAGGVAAASEALTGLGTESAQRIADSSEAALRVAAQASAALGAQQARAAGLHSLMANQLDALGERLAELAAQARDVETAFTPQVTQMDAQLNSVTDQLAAAQTLVGALATETAVLQSGAAAAAQSLATPIDAAQSAMARLGAEFAAAAEGATLLAAQLTSDTTGLTDAAARVAAQRGEVNDLMAELTTQLAAAEAQLAAIGANSRTAAATATVELVGRLDRISAATEATGVQMRETLARIVEGTVNQLAEAAVTGVTAAFAAPMAEQLVGVERAAQRAATAGGAATRRLSASMVRLVEVVSTVERRIDHVEARHQSRARDSMAAGATRLIEALRAGVVDLAELLAIDIGADVWQRYLAGDSAAFASAIVPRLDRDMALRLERLYRHDPAFAAETARYLGRFDDLVGRLVGDRDGEALAAMVLTSDLGKIYIVLAEAAGRKPPTRGPVTFN